MLVISAGMQKSGSAYCYNLINDLLIAAGQGDAHEIKTTHGLDHLMRTHNNNVGQLRPTTVLPLWWVSVKDAPFVVKTHSAPSRIIRLFSTLGLAKIIYSYRDPRDVLLSAMDHGRKIVEGGEHHTFASMVDFEDALRHAKGWLYAWTQYRKMPGVLIVKYEEFLADPERLVDQLTAFLDVGDRVPPEKRQAILWKHSKDNPGTDPELLHLNKAQACRYRTELSAEQQARCRQEFGRMLDRMGYPAD